MPAKVKVAKRIVKRAVVGTVLRNSTVKKAVKQKVKAKVQKKLNKQPVINAVPLPKQKTYPMATVKASTVEPVRAYPVGQAVVATPRRRRSG
mmetsp:Transcript_26073/g.33875  ORF Transcript_26073/g.33875 Transcript_26073/m.33875 type:complete len:92 (-) Transcript_26073:28-303(-)